MYYSVSFFSFTILFHLNLFSNFVLPKKKKKKKRVFFSCGFFLPFSVTISGQIFFFVFSSFFVFFFSCVLSNYFIEFTVLNIWSIFIALQIDDNWSFTALPSFSISYFLPFTVLTVWQSLKTEGDEEEKEDWKKKKKFCKKI